MRFTSTQTTLLCKCCTFGLLAVGLTAAVGFVVGAAVGADRATAFVESRHCGGKYDPWVGEVSCNATCRAICHSAVAIQKDIFWQYAIGFLSGGMAIFLFALMVSTARMYLEHIAQSPDSPSVPLVTMRVTR